MKKNRVVLLLILAVMAVAGCSGNKDYLKDGVNALEEKEYTKAVEYFNEMIAVESKEKPSNEKKQKIQDNNLFEAYKGLAIAYFEQEEYDKALGAYEEADKYDGTKTEAMYRNMAVCAQNIDDYEKAVIYANKGLENKGDSNEKDLSYVRRDLYYIIVKCNENNGKWSEALDIAKKYIEEFPDDANMLKEITFLETRQ